MKKIAIAAAALAMGSMSASAADLAARPYTKAPVAPLAVYNWGGFYIGGHVGGAWTNQEWVNTANVIPGGSFGDLSPGQGFRQSGSGIFGGGHAGYNWQASNFVFGLEGTISGLDTRGTRLNTVFGAGDDVFTWRSDWMATVTGRAGIAFNNNLFYVKGGYAGVNNRLAVSDTVPVFVGAGSQTHWHHGWTVGAGWEYAFAPNWSAKIEYNYMDFGTKSPTFCSAAGACGVFNIDQTAQVALFGVNYRFSSGAYR